MTHSTAVVGAVIVTFNRLSHLRQTLPKFLSETNGPVLVVDNASSDETQMWLAQQGHPRLTCLRLEDNLGGAGGFEAGLRHLTARADCDWVLLSDDDAWPEAGSLARFQAQRPEFGPDVGAVAAAVRLPAGPISEMNRPGWNPFWDAGRFFATLFRGNRAGFKVKDTAYAPDAPLIEVDNASFVGYYVARQAWERAGFPDGRLFIYGDDVLYSLRLRRANLRILFAPQITFQHDCRSMDGSYVYRPLWKIYYHCRNGVQIARQATNVLAFPFALLWYIRIWHKRGLHCAPEDRPIYRKMMWSGIRDGLMGRGGRHPHFHEEPPR